MTAHSTPIRERQSAMVVNVGLGANLGLAALKTAIGVLGHSPALLADGVNSTSDVAYYVVVKVFMRLARKPADDAHPYGHSQLESIAALVVGAFVVTTSVAIFWNAVNNVFDLLVGSAEGTRASVGALVVALSTVLLKIGLTIYSRQAGQRLQNAAVQALAYDHRNDVFSALAASVGIFLGRMGLPWVDPLAGALVALVILRTGIEILRSASADLMDDVPSQVLAKQITDVMRSVPVVKHVQDVHSHRFGPYLVISLTICIDGALTIAAGHEIAKQVEGILYDQIGLLRRVTVHVHPA